MNKHILIKHLIVWCRWKIGFRLTNPKLTWPKMNIKRFSWRSGHQKNQLCVGYLMPSCQGNTSCEPRAPTRGLCSKGCLTQQKESFEGRFCYNDFCQNWHFFFFFSKKAFFSCNLRCQKSVQNQPSKSIMYSGRRLETPRVVTEHPRVNTKYPKI